MKKYRGILFVFVMTAVLFVAFGCEPVERVGDKEDRLKKERELESEMPSKPVTLDTTVESLAEFVSLRPLPVRGIGLVVGLPGTGSTECPPDVRKYLSQYILTQVSRNDNINPNKMIDNLDTAVVYVESVIYPGALRRDRFAVNVRALSSTQTTSLNGGRLYTTELKAVGRIENAIQASRTLAVASGPVYIDTLDSGVDLREGVVVGGGRSVEDHQILLSLFDPDYRLAAAIRDRINERFGKGIANAMSQSIIYLKIPTVYQNKRGRFLELVESLYIASGERSQAQQIDMLIANLATARDKTKYETSLEAIGKSAANKLRPLLNSGDEITQFTVARVLLSMGIYDGISILRDVAYDRSSPLRIEAIKAIGDFAKERDVISLMNRIVRDDNFKVRYAAYEYLRKIDASSIVKTQVAKDFYLDRIIQVGPKVIYASRKDELGIALFGAPIRCQGDIYIESKDGKIIINSQPGEETLNVMRKHPFTGTLMGPLKTSYSLSELIRVLGSEPKAADAQQKSILGLGASYSDIIELLRTMCEKGAVDAEFVAGEMP